jgi:hypothetical protein
MARINSRLQTKPHRNSTYNVTKCHRCWLTTVADQPLRTAYGSQLTTPIIHQRHMHRLITGLVVHSWSSFALKVRSLLLPGLQDPYKIRSITLWHCMKQHAAAQLVASNPNHQVVYKHKTVNTC